MPETDLVLLHNPRCSKSRASLEILRQRGCEPQIVHYLDNPPDAAWLGRILESLQMEPRELMRRGETVYREKKLDDASLSREQLIAAMVADPVLIERPILLAGARAVIGRPPERVLELLA